MTQNPQQGRPIIFICHSLGGLVVQKALLHSDESPDLLYNDVVDSTADVIFMGTPHRGSTLANWGGLGADFAHIVKDVNQAIVKLLRPDSEILFQLRDSFIKLVIRRAKQEKGSIKIKCYFEELGMTLMKKVYRSITSLYISSLKECQIVTEESAVFEGYPFESIHADHMKIIKFESYDGVPDETYTDVMESIYVMINHSKLFVSSPRALNPLISRYNPPAMLTEGTKAKEDMLSFG